VNRTGQLLGLFAALALVLALLVRGGGRGRPDGAAEALLFPRATEQNARAVEIRLRDGTSTRLEKAGEAWGVAEAGGYPADPEGVTAIFDRIGKIAASQIVSKNRDKHALYEVDSTALAVRVLDEKGEPLARFFVGKNGSDFQSNYVRPVDSDNVYLASEAIRSVFDRGRRGWRDRKILSFAMEDVVGLRFLSADDNLAFEKHADGTWRLGDDSTRVGRTPVIEGVLRTMARYITDDFADTTIAADTVGLAPPDRMIEVTLRAGGPETLEIGRLKEERQYWVRRGGKPTLFLVARARVETIFKTRADATEPRQAPAAAAASDTAAADAAH
jgi:hypothetical protein